ncbi:MAG: hypothetical protein F4186_13010 [Boseongicola sp. SB0676_bin_33]|nr:hypothetical protein [Boseongicola sp. SB0676_bin_33]
MNDRARNGEKTGIGPTMSRQERLRHALRENLKRRKDQKRRREQREHNRTNENRSSSKGI